METNAHTTIYRVNNFSLYTVNFSRSLDLVTDFLYSYNNNEINKLYLGDWKNCESVVKLLCQNTN